LNIGLVDECFTSSAPYAGHAEQLFLLCCFLPVLNISYIQSLNQ
jgi:hypothetical protein